ncbi:conserved hypothetical protein [Theileria equi strain WA]|uniref:Serine aminopeptidase S33 domain-containing protein n=1 Tax=Theileria equi strain WA TaxID=1537102 RepID=L1LBJ1_THEEQ|nr:conserved hypothetical protein [Theileria equi strain WA]EKX72777.1 conserved hypothetical protein [Theileria equi strain WA]|eukprot:XP_004832229.1 conserved hypothetical protein [Theileria equi strain WA]
MNFIAILFVLHVFAAGLCENTRSAEKVTLDIAHVDSCSIKTLKRWVYELCTGIYTAKDGYQISTVVDKETPLWISARGHSCEHVVVVFGKNGIPRSVVVYTSDDEHAKSCLYLERVGSEWVSVTEEEFYKRFHALIVKEALFDSVEVDINQKETSIRLYATNSPSLPFLVYAPNVGYRIKRVGDGWIKTIWKAKLEDEECTYASLYPKDEPKLAYLIVRNPDVTRKMFFHKANSSWEPIKKEIYLKELDKAGFNLAKLNDKATLDIRNVDKGKFRDHAYILRGYEALYRPLPGFRIDKVVDGEDLIWEPLDGEQCIYVSAIVQDVLPVTCYLFIVDEHDDRTILHYIKDGNSWRFVDNDTYFTFLTDGDNPAFTHRGGTHKLVSSGFKNKQGHRLTTYASTVDNPKGDIILVHGFRGYFKADFGRYNYLWNFKQFGYPSAPNVYKLFVDEDSELQKNPSVANRYKHLFEHASEDDFNAFEMAHKFKYNGGFSQVLNKLGYNVYGFDHQSQGLSEAISDLRCYVNNFKDYIYDTLQFVSIVKRGKFGDPDEEWNEGAVYKNIPTDRKVFLIGHSMGANISIRAIQEFHKHAEGGARLIDGLICTSAMLNLDHHLNTPVKRLFRKMSKLLTLLVPYETTRYEQLLDNGESFDMFARYNDPFFHSSWTVMKTHTTLFDAAEDIHKEEHMRYYPKDLPTLLFHANDDFMCNIKGPRDMIKNYFSDSKVTRLIEIEGTCHYLTVAHAGSRLVLQFHDWLHNTPKMTSATRGIALKSDEL